MTAEDTLAQIAKEVTVCTKCALHSSRKKAVPGEGPGFHENEQGRPFVGAAGQFLDQLLAQAGVTRADVFITNVVKCRPPQNRDPMPDEIETCTSNYLDHQIEAISPSIIVTLGRFSMNKFFPGAKISAVHGQMRKVGDRYVIAMFHPAAALHQASIKPQIMADFAKLPELLKQARAGMGKSAPVEKVEDKKEEDDPKQMSMF